MSRRTAATEAEIKRAIKAAQTLGYVVRGIQITDGKVEIVLADGEPVPPIMKPPSLNEWDEVLR